jgi:zinc transporter
LFGRDACGRTLSAAEAAAWIHGDGGLGGDEFLWLHFNLAHNAAERWIKTHLDLSEQFFEALRDGSHTTRIEHTDGSLIAVINDVHYDFSFAPSSISTLWISISERLVITARRHALRSVDRLRAAVRRARRFAPRWNC